MVLHPGQQRCMGQATEVGLLAVVAMAGPVVQGLLFLYSPKSVSRVSAPVTSS